LPQQIAHGSEISILLMAKIMTRHRVLSCARKQPIERALQPRVQKIRLSASEFMKKRPHFVTWTVMGLSGTGIFCHPTDDPPFDLGRISGIVDASGVFHSTDCSDLYVNGRQLHTVGIEPDNDPE